MAVDIDSLQIEMQYLEALELFLDWGLGLLQ